MIPFITGLRPTPEGDDASASSRRSNRQATEQNGASWVLGSIARWTGHNLQVAIRRRRQITRSIRDRGAPGKILGIGLPAAGLLFALMVAGCASPLATPTTNSTTSAPPSVAPSPVSTATTPRISTPSPSIRTIAIELANGKVSPNGARVNLSKGERFVLDITSDRDDKVHVPGFDKEVDVAAGKRAKLELVADRTGRYEVESHDPALLIVVLQIR